MLNYFFKRTLIKPLVILLAELILWIPMYGGVNSANERKVLSVNSTSQTGVNFKLQNSRPFIPGDGVIISTYPDTASFLNNTFPIDDNGYIDLPLVGRIKIVKMSEDELVGFLKKNFKAYLKYPNVIVRPAIRVSILGGVKNPGLYYIDPNRSFWEVIYYVGGPLDEDGLKSMHWERDKKIIKKNLIPFFQSGISLKEMGFKSGDQIWVRTPGKPGTLDKVLRFVPILTFISTFVTLYIAYQYRTLSR